MATRTAPATLSRQKRIRKIFGNIHEVIDMPNLIEVQRESSSCALTRRVVMYPASKKRCAAFSRLRILPERRNSTSSITNSKIPNMTLKNAVSAELPMRRR